MTYTSDRRFIREIGDLIVREQLKFAMDQASLKHYFDELKAKPKQITIYHKVLADNFRQRSSSF